MAYQLGGVLLPVFPRSTGDGPVASPPFFRADVGGTRTGPDAVEGVGRVQPGEQDVVQLFEDAGRVPSAQPAPAGLSGAEP
jgi:hypothetical protein